MDLLRCQAKPRGQMKSRKDFALLAIILPPAPGCHPLTSDASDHSDAVIMTQHNTGTSGPCLGAAHVTRDGGSGPRD